MISFEIAIFLIILGLIIAVVIVVYLTPIANIELRKERRYTKSTTTQETKGGTIITTTDEFEQAKTLWDLQQVLIVPLVIALLTVVFSTLQSINSEQLALDQQRQTTLESYMQHMSDLLSGTNVKTLLHDSKKGDEVRNVARGLTLVALRGLDPERKRILVQFLYNADLITWHHWPGMAGADFPILDMAGADLSGADLSNMYLTNANLDGTLLNNANLDNSNLDISSLFKVDLHNAHLVDTTLNGVDLRQANLSRSDYARVQLRGSHWPPDEKDPKPKPRYMEANLTEADLSYANMSGADLSYANMSEAHLEGVNFFLANLKGANMNRNNWKEAILNSTTQPNGSEYPFRGLGNH